MGRILSMGGFIYFFHRGGPTLSFLPLGGLRKAAPHLINRGNQKLGLIFCISGVFCGDFLRKTVGLRVEGILKIFIAHQEGGFFL